MTGLAVNIDKQPLAAEVNQRFLTYLVRDGQYVVLYLTINFIDHCFLLLQLQVMPPVNLKLGCIICIHLSLLL